MKIEQLKKSLGKFKGNKGGLNIQTPTLDDYKNNDNNNELRPYNKPSDITPSKPAQPQIISSIKASSPKVEKIQPSPELNTQTLKMKEAVSNHVSTEKTQEVAADKRHIGDTIETQQSPEPQGIRDTEETHKRHSKRHNVITNMANKCAISSCSKLSGNAFNIVKEIFLDCVSNHSLETNFIPKEEFSKRTGVKIGSIKTTAYRLIERNIINDIQTTKGRNSLWKFILSQTAYDEMILILSTAKLKGDTTRDTNSLSSSSNYNINKTTTSLPFEWSQIKTEKLKEILTTCRAKGKQFFGIAQIKSIYYAMGSSISAKEVQNSIDKFAYGLEHYMHEEPYKTMDKPAAILFASLKNGDLWEDERCLISSEQELKNIYDNINNNCNQTYSEQFSSWVDNNNEILTLKYKSRHDSSRYFGKSEFYEYAKEDFRKTIWPKIKEKELLSIMGIENQSFIKKMLKLESLLSKQ